MRIVKSIFFLLVLLMLSTINAQAQKCGGGFAYFTVISDSTGKVVPRVTIEIVANFYEEDYLELLKKHKEGRMLNENERSFRVPEQAVSETIKQSIPLEREKDNCGHPLKLVSKVENAVERNFGFCFSEGDTKYYLLRISAPDYITTYYIGNYLGGCSPGRKFVVSKKENTKSKFQFEVTPKIIFQPKNVGTQFFQHRRIACLPIGKDLSSVYELPRHHHNRTGQAWRQALCARIANYGL